ncbi:hypothetical protein BC832DRAFT_406030 [Gaertneriomyces semiglobifer]|nr:hypothetical protein BC832DRAFT_406030 [Gaertneriomyces semiglobifer]
MSCVPDSVPQMITHIIAEPIAGVPSILLSSNDQDDKHLHVARSVLFDFWAMVRHLSGNVLVPGRERKHLIEQVSPLFKHMEHTFHTIVFDWVERPANSTKSLREMCEGNRQTFAVDVLGIAAADRSEITYVEHSGSDTDNAETMRHAGDDTVKLINEAIDGAKYRLCKYLDAPAEQARSVKSLPCK